MKNFGLASVVIGGMAATVIGLATPASAMTGLGFETGHRHHDWLTKDIEGHNGASVPGFDAFGRPDNSDMARGVVHG